jgi:hypothetical protein
MLICDPLGEMGWLQQTAHFALEIVQKELYQKDLSSNHNVAKSRETWHDSAMRGVYEIIMSITPTTAKA